MLCWWKSRLIIGYVFHSDGSMYPVSSCDLQLDAVGEDGKDPVDWKFNFIAGFLYCCYANFFALLYILYLVIFSQSILII